MRRTLMIVSLLLVACLSFACGERTTTTTATNANAQSNTAGTQGTGATSGTGPKTEGIGGAANGSAVNGNTYTVPQGFNQNGDRGSASNVRNTP
ncbi:MAG TPA: hypothetical protein VJT74_04780 [Pyrinomonadaceae bacterium]|nr:hypothetical protein [Pyrinomonadaceae bacterium]